MKKLGGRRGNLGFRIFIAVFLISVTLVMAFPFWLVVVNSFASEASISKFGFQVWPSEFTLAGYKYLLKGGQIFTSYKNSLIITVAGTVMATFLTTTYAYFLSAKKVKYRNTFSFLTYMAMLMGTSLVGFYIMITRLNLKDTLWALILPNMLNPFYAFILVSGFKEIPYELNEAAYMDGAGGFQIFSKIIVPVAKPTIVIIMLFYTLQYWNDWWLSVLFIDDYKLHPLQMMIRQMISNINASSYINSAGSLNIVVPTNSIKMVVVCATIGPIILVYPFIQKYFVKGITLGAVKG